MKMKGWLKLDINYIKINSDLLEKNILEMFNKKQFKEIIKLNDIIKNKDSYVKYKSWRTSSLEGNTTNLVQYKKIKESNLRTEENLLSNTFGEQYEIRNTIKVYEDLSIETKKLNLNSLMQINYMLGEDIFLNDFIQYRGKLKTVNNCVKHSHGIVFFADYTIVKNELEKLLKTINFLNEKLDFSKSFILSMIFQLEFTRIHPFKDGNGRTSRIVAETIMEKNGFSPFIITKEKNKRKFKELLFNIDYKNNSINNRHEYEEYIEEIYKLYVSELKYLIENKSELL